MANAPRSNRLAPKPTVAGRVFAPASTRKGILTWGKLLTRKTHELHDGITCIGRRPRKGEELPTIDNECDLPVNEDILVGDDYMSRRTAMITATGDGGFKLTFLRSSNPIFFNGEERQMGESIYPNDGDQFKLGRTVFTFRIKKQEP